MPFKCELAHSGAVLLSCHSNNRRLLSLPIYHERTENCLSWRKNIHACEAAHLRSCRQRTSRSLSACLSISAKQNSRGDDCHQEDKETRIPRRMLGGCISIASKMETGRPAIQRIVHCRYWYHVLGTRRSDSELPQTLFQVSCPHPGLFWRA